MFCFFDDVGVGFDFLFVGVYVGDVFVIFVEWVVEIIVLVVVFVDE